VVVAVAGRQSPATATPFSPFLLLGVIFIIPHRRRHTFIH